MNGTSVPTQMAPPRAATTLGDVTNDLRGLSIPHEKALDLHMWKKGSGWPMEERHRSKLSRSQLQ